MKNLAQFKKALTVGVKVNIINHARPELSRNTEVLHAQSNSVCFDLFGKPSWFEFPKATNYAPVNDKTGNILFAGNVVMTISII